MSTEPTIDKETMARLDMIKTRSGEQIAKIMDETHKQIMALNVADLSVDDHTNLALGAQSAIIAYGSMNFLANAMDAFEKSPPEALLDKCIDAIKERMVYGLAKSKSIAAALQEQSKN